jgi:hypothetical protein
MLENIDNSYFVLVRYRGEEIRLSDIGLGREFAYQGRLYQTSVRPTTFSAVEEGARFRFLGQWYIKAKAQRYAPVEPNTPFGMKGSRSYPLIVESFKVDVLEVMDRGTVPK